MRALAAANDLESVNLVVEGAKLRLPGAVASAPALELSRSTVRAHIDKWAAHYGISVNLARALAWQESGFQTNVTSSTGAWGPMQIMPDTWTFVETVLLGRTVPRTGEGGVEVGMTLLNHLLKRFGGDQRLALAAWYQGEKAVREHGLYAETKSRSSRACSRSPAGRSSRERRDRRVGAAGGLVDARATRASRAAPGRRRSRRPRRRASLRRAGRASAPVADALAREVAVAAVAGEVLGDVDARDPVDVLGQVSLDLGRVARRARGRP